MKVFKPNEEQQLPNPHRQPDSKDIKYVGMTKSDCPIENPNYYILEDGEWIRFGNSVCLYNSVTFFGGTLDVMMGCEHPTSRSKTYTILLN